MKPYETKLAIAPKFPQREIKSLIGHKLDNKTYETIATITPNTILLFKNQHTLCFMNPHSLHNQHTTTTIHTHTLQNKQQFTNIERERERETYGGV